MAPRAWARWPTGALTAQPAAQFLRHVAASKEKWLSRPQQSSQKPRSGGALFVCHRGEGVSQGHGDESQRMSAACRLCKFEDEPVHRQSQNHASIQGPLSAGMGNRRSLPLADVRVDRVPIRALRMITWSARSSSAGPVLRGRFLATALTARIARQSAERRSQRD